MGNAKLRRQAASLLKSRGLGPLYRGNKKLAWRHYRGYRLRRLIERLQLQEGDLQQDCDAFNHRFKSFELERLNYDGGEFVVIDSVQWMDGTFSCGCGYSPSPPWSPEEITRYHMEFVQAFEDDRPSYVRDWIREALRRGWPICDDNGMSLREEIEMRLDEEKD